MSLVGRKNAYVCKECDGQTVTVDRDDGVTPFMLRCRATVGCRGFAQSSFYDCDQALAATHEWYAPSPSERLASSHAAQDHYRNGGLALRAVSAPRQE